MSVDSSAAAPARTKYVRAVGPRLRQLLYVVFVLVALLGANSVYLAGITALDWYHAGAGVTYQSYFYLWMFLGHLVLGLVLIVPFLVFGIVHLMAARKRRNRRAVRMGYALFAVCVAVLITGVLLMRVGGFDLKHPTARSVVYWLHVASPLAAGWLYWLHRLAGPRIRWRVGIAYAGALAVVVSVMIGLHRHDPRQWNVAGPEEGERYFFPSLTRTASGNFVPAKTLMMDEYCKICHSDVHEGWANSVHRFSSFNNPAYLAAVRETREVSLKRDGTVRASRFCAGCHDPVPFLSGAFDDPNYDDIKDPTAHAGISCTVCHAISHVAESGPRGNGDYTIDEPVHYPFAFSDNSMLQFVNQQLVKAKPALHKKTFLKPFHQSAEFCATCHKVHLPEELNHYKWLRGQNHYDTFLLSGVSGHGARSFYYPPQAQANCNGCHMPLKPSNDFGAKFFGDAKELSIHSHLFPSANTAIAHWRGRPDIVAEHQKFLEGVMRVDLFGIKEGARIDGKLHAPLRPEVPVLEPGQSYLLETVIRTLKLGHPFTQGTVDSNEVWLEVTATSGGRVLGKSGGLDEAREVDPWSHFVNVYMLDREGKRIARRNAQDIYTPLYNNQIPPGAGQTVHYELKVPSDVTGPVTVEVRLQYRKFDKIYTDFVTSTRRPEDAPISGHEPGRPYLTDLPITTLAEDRVTFPVAGIAETPVNHAPPVEPWMRWNDYGIGLLLKGKAELKQAAEAFTQVEKLGRYDGVLNSARVHYTEGRLDDAVAALKRAAACTDPAPPTWTVAWLTGLVNAQQGHLDRAIENLATVVDLQTPEMQRRKFDFSKDYEVLNDLGAVLYQRARQERGRERQARREEILREARRRFEQTLALDSENAVAHYNLFLIASELGESARAAEHRALHEKYRPDDNARDRVIAIARRNSAAANSAAEPTAIYPLHRPGAPGLQERTAAATGRTSVSSGGGR